MLKLHSLERINGLTKDAFAKSYLAARKPIILTDLMDTWPAKTKWTIDFFKSTYGEIQVPLYKTNRAKGEKYIEPDVIMPLHEYLSLLESGPTELRIFLFNLFREIPELLQDYSTPDIMDGFINSFPFLFFGGKGADVSLHYDMDLSHIFLSQFHGRKRVVLFAPEQSKNIYHHPFTVASYIDVNNPNYDEFPALKNVEGYECILHPGETLFMPSGYWHYIEYLDGGYSISLRANDSYARRVRGALSIAQHFVVDKTLHYLMGQSWNRMKAEMAKRRAEEV